MSLHIPTRTMFDEAISPGLLRYRLKILDDELKLGHVEMAQVGPGLQAPFGFEGGFAIVYKFYRRDGSLCALRCSKSKTIPDMEQRYQQFGPYFAKHAKAFTAGFTYHSQGIQLKFDENQSEVYPVIIMDWMEGPTLLEKMDKLCRANDRSGLGRLAEKWGELMVAMHDAHIAHGDLAGENVKVVPPDDRLVLIDYDSVYIPSLAGMKPVAYGQKDYQHPDMMGRPFDERMDHFSALVIYSALVALREQPKLWQSRVMHDNNGKVVSQHILFQDDDFKQPNQSSLFKELQRIQQPDVKAAVDLLSSACQGLVNNVPVPYTLFQPEKQALKRLAEAIQSDDDEKIVQAWVVLLENYPPAQTHLPRVEKARRRLAALEKFRAALQTDKDEWIIPAYDPLLDHYPEVTQVERDRLALAKQRQKARSRFASALAGNDDEVIIHAYDPVLDSILSPEERQRLDLARTRLAALQRFRNALASDDDDAILQAYPPLPDDYPKVAPHERDRLNLARNRVAALKTFNEAIQRDDDKSILAVYAAHKNLLDSSPRFTQAMRQRRDLAQQRTNALTRFRGGLLTSDPAKILAAYDPVLDEYPGLNELERDELKWAEAVQGVRDGLKKLDDTLIQRHYRPSLEQHYNQVQRRRESPFTQAETRQLGEFQARVAKEKSFRAALFMDDDEAIIRAYDPILDNSSLLQKSDRDRLELARRRSPFQTALKTNDDVQIVKAHHPTLDAALTVEERQRLDLARTRLAALKRFRNAVASDDDDAIALAYDPVLDPPYRGLTSADRDRLTLARNRLAALTEFAAAVQADDDPTILKVYRERQSLLDSSPRFSQAMRLRRDLAQQRIDALNRFRAALLMKDDETIVRAYNPILDPPYPGLTSAERDQLTLARNRLAAFKEFDEAIQSDDDKRILAIYATHKNLLDSSPKVIQAMRQRHDLARRRTDALKRFRKALLIDDDEAIVQAYDPILAPPYAELKPGERDRLALARNHLAAFKQFDEAIQSDDDQHILAVYAAHKNLLDTSPKVTQAMRQRHDLAQERQAMYDAVKAALTRADEPAIADAFKAALKRPWMSFTADETARIQLARGRKAALQRLNDALKTDNDLNIVFNYSPKYLDGYPGVTPEQRERVHLAQRRQAALTKLREALLMQDEREIAAAYDPILDNYPDLRESERAAVEDAQRCVTMPNAVRKALAANDDEAIVAAYDEKLLRPFMKLSQTELTRIKDAQRRVAALAQFREALAASQDERAVTLFEAAGLNAACLTEDERERLELARGRRKARQAFRLALASDSDAAILASYNPILDNTTLLQKDERDQLDQARARTDARVRLDQAIAQGDDAAIVNAYDTAIGLGIPVTLEEQYRYDMSHLRCDALAQFRDAIASQDDSAIVAAYDHILDTPAALQPQERARLTLAQQRLAMPTAVRAAMANDDDAAILAAYNRDLDNPSTQWTPDEQARLALAIKRAEATRQIRAALDARNVEQALHIEQAASTAISDPRFSEAKLAYLQPLDPLEVNADLRNNELLIQWKWPDSRFIRGAAVVWRTDGFPHAPHEDGATTMLVTRKEAEERGILRRTNTAADVYIRVFAGLPDPRPLQPEQWSYSPGTSPGAQAVAHRPRPVRWRLTQRRGSRFNSLELQTTDGRPLPDLDLVRKAGMLPMTVMDGEMVYQLRAAESVPGPRIVIPLEVEDWPRETVLRVFSVAMGDDTVPLDIQPGLKIEIS